MGINLTRCQIPLKYVESLISEIFGIWKCSDFQGFNVKHMWPLDQDNYTDIYTCIYRREKQYLYVKSDRQT